MEVENTYMPVVSFTPAPCPECGEKTSLVNLGNEPPREVCVGLSCQWDGVTLASK
jgi:hypothetical protein